MSHDVNNGGIKDETTSESTQEDTVTTVQDYVDPDVLLKMGFDNPETVEGQIQEDIEQQVEQLEDDVEEVTEFEDEGNEEETLETEDVEVDDDDAEEEEEEEEEEIDDDEDAEEDTWFHVGEHSTYRTAADAIKGIEAKDTYIISLENTSSELKTDLVELQKKLAFYTDNVGEDILKVGIINSLLPEEYRGKTEGDFEDDEELRKFWKAQVQAEAKYNDSLDERSKEIQRANDANEEKAKKAAKFIKDTATSEFFGVKNPEERNTLKDVLIHKGENGYTPLDEARLIAEVFGETAATDYLEGLKSRVFSIKEEKSEGVTSRKKVVVQKTPPKKVVQKVKKTTLKKKSPITPPPQENPRDKYSNVEDPEVIISAGFNNPV